MAANTRVSLGAGVLFLLGAVVLFLFSNLHLSADTAEDKKSTDGHRLVSMRILLDDQELFECATSDDGHPNADAVWDYLKLAEFRRGEDFADSESKIRRDENGVSLTGDVKVDVAYGGQLTVRELTLNRTVTDNGERWTVPENLVDKWFWFRFVHRLNAEHLKGFHELRGQR